MSAEMKTFIVNTDLTHPYWARFVAVWDLQIIAMNGDVTTVEIKWTRAGNFDNRLYWLGLKP